MDAKNQMLFDMRLPAGQAFVTPKELAAASGFSARFIQDSFDSGRVLGFAATGRGDGERTSIRIPRELALTWLIKVSNFDAAILDQHLTELVAKLPRNQVTALQAACVKRLAGHR